MNLNDTQTSYWYVIEGQHHWEGPYDDYHSCLNDAKLATTDPFKIAEVNMSVDEEWEFDSEGNQL